ncbi:hypothetical protein CHU98_g12097 [Xylaria longipes]|nr:hypothetical protein CHU98_g12097 [Xylaria longipes]
MLAFDVVGGTVPSSPSKLGTNDDSSNPRLEPRTLELGKRKANEGHCGLPTPDATPKSDILPQTPPISPKASSKDKIPGERYYRFSQDSIHCEAEELLSERLSASSIHAAPVNQETPLQGSIYRDVEEPVSKRVSASPFHAASASQETSRPSLSIAQRLLALGIRFINMATQRSSRANATRVENTICLIKSVPSIRRTRVTNLRRKLTAYQYRELLRAIQNSEDVKLQAFIEDELQVGVDKWITQLQGAVDAKISNAARSFVSTGSADVEFPFAKGESDSKSPDKSFMPRESRELDETNSYSYEKDQENETGEASILIWRPGFRRGGGVDATCVQNKKFRDEKGNPIGSAVLRLPLQDFICKATEDSSAGNYVAPQLELLAGDLCMWIDEAVVKYRTKRNRAVKKEAEDEKQKQKQQQADARKNSKREQGIGSRGDSSRTSRSEGPAASTGCTRPGKFVKG